MQLSFYSELISLDHNYLILLFILLHFSLKTFQPGLALIACVPGHSAMLVCLKNNLAKK